MTSTCPPSSTRIVEYCAPKYVEVAFFFASMPSFTTHATAPFAPKLWFAFSIERRPRPVFHSCSLLPPAMESQATAFVSPAGTFNSRTPPAADEVTVPPMARAAAVAGIVNLCPATSIVASAEITNGIPASVASAPSVQERITTSYDSKVSCLSTSYSAAELKQTVCSAVGAESPHVAVTSVQSSV